MLSRLKQGQQLYIVIVPVDLPAVIQELITEELVCGEERADGDEQVHDLAAEEPEGVAVELVMDVLLEVAQHPAHLLLGVVHDATGRT